MRRLLLAIALCIGAGETNAQGIAPGPIRGVSMERHQIEQSLAFTYRMTELHPRAPGADLGVALFPRYLADRQLAATLDLGLAQAAPAGGSLLFLRGGGGALVLVGAGGGGILPALQAGVALVVPLDPRTALRFDLGEHWYWADREFERRWSVGVGFAALPERR